MARRHFSLWNSAHSGDDQVESQVLPSYQNRQISALDEMADAPQSSLFSLLSSLIFSSLAFLSCLVFSSLVLSCLVLPSCLVSSSLVLSCLVLSCLVLSCLVLSLSCLFHLVLPSCLVASSFVFSSLSLSLKHMCAWCRYTRGRFEWTEGGVFESTQRDVLNGPTGGRGHRQFCIPKFAHVWSSRASEVHQRNQWILPIFSLRKGRESNTLPIAPIIRCA